MLTSPLQLLLADQERVRIEAPVRPFSMRVEHVYRKLMMAVLMVQLAASNSYSLGRLSPSLQWLARFGRDLAHLKALEKRYQVV